MVNMMKKTVKIISAAALLLFMASFVICCARYENIPEEQPAQDSTELAEDVLQAAIRLSDDVETAWQNGTAKHINLSDDGSTASDSGVKIQGKTVTVTSAGIYSISGTLTEGQLVVDCEGTVALILEDVEISNLSDASICVSGTDYTLIYLPEGSTNKLVSGTEQEITATNENTDVESASGAALYAKDSLFFAGNGKLIAGGYINNAVATTKQLVVLGGELELTAVNNGLKGKDSVTVLDGVISVCSGNDGIKANNDSDIDSGYIDIHGGEINIVSYGDGIQAEKNLSVEGGSITISAGDTENIDSGKTMQPFENYPGNMHGPEGMRGGFPGMFGQNQVSEEDSEASTKGIKSGGNITVSGGSISINSVDDCMHANGSITVTGGTLRLSTGDDGLHADETLTVSDGDIIVSKAYEGLEGHEIYLCGGIISVTASDDGINAGGGSSDMFGRMFGASAAEESSLPILKISGGTLYVNADGDGLDSNGNLFVEGGNIIVDGPTNSGNGALDSGSENGGSIICNGGTIIAVGASGMAETFENNSTQCSFIKNFSQTMAAGTQITISDESGKTIFEHKSAKSFNSIVFSSPELVPGSTYTITVGSQTDTITIENISNGASSGFGRPGGFGRQEGFDGPGGFGGHNRR